MIPKSKHVPAMHPDAWQQAPGPFQATLGAWEGLAEIEVGEGNHQPAG